MELIEALRIVYELAEGNQITKEEADIEGPSMWQTCLDQENALTMINDILENRVIIVGVNA